MKKIIFVLLSAIMLQSFARAQFFQNPGVSETDISGTATSAHIYYATNYSMGNTNFPDFPSDLYVATWQDQFYSHANQTQLYYKRTEANNPANILIESYIAIQEAIIWDAVIINNPDFINGVSANEYCVVVGYTKGHEGWIDYYEWDISGLNFITNYQFASYAPGDNIISLRMDANNASDFVLVFEDYNHELFAFTGTDQSFFPYATTPLTDFLGITESGLFPDVAMNKNNSVGGITGVKLFFSYINTDKDACLIKEAYLDDLRMGGALMVNQIHTIEDYFGHYVLDLSKDYKMQEDFFPNLNTSNFLIRKPSPVFGGLYGPLIDAPDNSTDDTWAVIVEQVAVAEVEGSTAPPPFSSYNIPYGTIVAAALYNNGVVHDKVLNVKFDPIKGSTISYEEIPPPPPPPPPTLSPPFKNPFFYGIPGGLNMAFKNDDPNTFWFEPMYVGMPAVAFTKDNNNVVFAWGKTNDIPMMNNREYIALIMDQWGNVVPGASGEVYRLIDFNTSLEPYHKVVALSGENVTTNDLYTIFTADIYNPNYDECLYEKHPDWGRISNQGFRPAGIKDEEIAKKLFKAFPSPFQSTFSLAFIEKNQENYQMSMTDIFGRTVFQANGNVENINRKLQKHYSLLQQLSPGIYLIHLNNGNQSENIKIIKE